MVNSLSIGRSGFDFENAIVNLDLLISIFRFSYDNGLVPLGNKPLPETMLTQIYVAIWQ